MNLNESLEGLRKIDLNDLDLNNVGSWPAAVKFIAGTILFVGVLFLGYNFHLKDLQVQLEASQAQELTLKELGWKPQKFTETGQPMVDEAILDQIIKDCEK